MNKLTGSPWNQVFIHIDKKTDIKPFYNSLHNNHSVHFIEDRIKVYWGGYSSVLATINLFNYALNHGRYDRFIILQGLDYPIRSNEEIYDFLQKNKNTEFIKASDGTNDKQIKTQHKYCFIWFLDGNHILKKAWNKLNTVLLKCKLILKFKKMYVDEKDIKYNIYEGWAHFALTRDCAKYIVDFYDTHPKFNKYFTTVYASDESYFHTIVYNSKFITNTVDGKSIEKTGSRLNLTYFEYPKYVTVFKDRSDFDKLYNTNYLFFRKASSESKELLDYIDNYHQSTNMSCN